jgi:hypothetical protein
MKKGLLTKILTILIHLLILFFLYRTYFFVVTEIGECVTVDVDFNEQCSIEKKVRETAHIIILTSFYIVFVIILPRIAKALLQRKRLKNTKKILDS